MKIFAKIKALVSVALSHAGTLISDSATVAVKVVDVLKNVVNKPALDILTELTKTDLDNAVLRKVRAALAVVPTALGLTAGVPTVEAAHAALVTSLRTMPSAMQSAVYAKTASAVAVALSGGKLSEAEADVLTQMAYASQKA